MVSGDENCNVDIVLSSDDPSSISHCNVSSLDPNTFRTKNALHACVDSPCISCVNCLHKSHYDMLDMSCCHEQNVSISSSCLAKNVEETKRSMEQGTNMGDASRRTSFPSVDTHMCLMAKGSKVTPTLITNTSSNDDSDDDNDEETDETIAGLYKVRCSLRGDALAKFDFLMKTVASRDETIEGLESHIENEKRRFNLLRQELKDERCISQGLKQKLEDRKSVV